MKSTFDPRAATWRTLLSLPGRVGIVEAVDRDHETILRRVSTEVRIVGPGAFGVIRTDMSKAIWQRHEAAIAERVPAARIGEPDDVAGAVVFFASDAARYVTGQTLVVDGGEALGQGVVPS